ncbi:CCR4-NOT transcription complex subunit 2 [Aplysia californica]|uniref:CCR4-NOT transcription complex subunit 2 n=1 Tax=Aplysia californica TaxID=6500 RepID=A0ABM0JMH7_APLCA|nr:CCR4-NOT transcription complex subunit 2 [Aplysia californica]
MSQQFSNMFRPDKDLNSGMMPSQSPSQMPGFSGGTNFYGQGTLPLQQRAIGGNHFRGGNNAGHITPTSMNPGFPMGLQQQQQPQQQQQHSPNSLAAIGPRSVLGVQSQAGQASLASLQKRAFSSAGPMQNFASSYGFGGSRSIDSHPTIDLSDFPTLSSRSSATPNPLPTTRNYVGMVSKPAQDSAPEFNITQEEFPALPGAQSSFHSFTPADPPVQSGEGNGAVGGDQLNNKDGVKGDGKPMLQAKRGIQTHPDGTISNIPSGMVMDQFGIVGLLSFIRAAEQDANMVALAPGIDLTTLGLNLNSPENLYSMFQSPFAESACRPQDIDYHVPAEYLTNMFIRDKLAPIKLNRYSEDLLFYLFYMNGGDVLQLAAAAELYSRDWRYHKEERVWLTRAPQYEVFGKTSTSERGTYIFFDANNWRRNAKEFHLEYDKLEERPVIPSYSFNQMGSVGH